MKKGLWLIFKCQNCGKVFQEKITEDVRFSSLTGVWQNDKEIMENIGRKTHIVSTHKCKPDIYGYARLIGCKNWGNGGEQ